MYGMCSEKCKAVYTNLYIFYGIDYPDELRSAAALRRV